MLRVLVPIVLALAIATAASAGGGKSVSGDGVRYIATGQGGGTVLRSIGGGGVVYATRRLAGSWRVPSVTVDGQAGGLSADGRVLVLVEPRSRPGTSRLLMVGTKRLRPRGTITLRGEFSFDALSPGGSVLYLIEHVGSEGARYRVRAYDVRRHRLVPGVIAEKGQQDWTMAGLPVARAASPDGEWVYTMYRQRGNYPFIHSLNTKSRFAVCVAIPQSWKGQRLTGALRLDGPSVLIADRRGAPTRWVLDTRSFRISPAA